MRCIFFLAIMFLSGGSSYAQQDVAFLVNRQFFPGKNIISVKRDFHDPYLWVLAENNEVYRINSATMIVDDFTARFNLYNNLKFIDIAGLNKDTVFIATNSNNLIQFKSGASKIVGENLGITTSINSIGITKAGFHEYYTYDGSVPPVLVIGSDAALYHYDIRAEVLTKEDGDRASKVYDASFRSQMVKDSIRAPAEYMGIKRVPVQFEGEYSGFIGYLWEGGVFGDNIKTAAMLPPSMFDNDIRTHYMMMFWGSKNGLFQNNWNLSFFQDSEYGHYLDGISVNKISSIYGLAAFGEGGWYGDPGKIKQTLLVGTDHGLYFSSSIYQSGQGGLRTFEIFHADILGDIVVNDISVNVASMPIPLCEDGVWVATVKGLYYLKPDYATYLKPAKLDAASFLGLPESQKEVNICAGEYATAFIDTRKYTANSIQWYKDNQQIPGESARELKITASGEYHAVLYDPCADIHQETNIVKATIISSPVFSFNYPDILAYCDSVSATLKVDFSPSYHYRWLKDGVFTGDNQFKMKATTNGRYKVEVSACDGNWVPSKEVLVILTNLPDPIINADKMIYCEGGQAYLTLNIPISADYNINWYMNGQKMPFMDNKTGIICLADATYTVQLTSTYRNCTKNSPAIGVKFIKSPVISLNYTGINNICEGEPLNLTVQGSRDNEYRWYRDGVLTGNTSAALEAVSSGKYFVEASACENSWVRSETVTVNVISFNTPIIVSPKKNYCKGDIAALSLQQSLGDDYAVTWQRDGIAVAEFAGFSQITTVVPGNYTAIVTSKLNTGCTRTSTAYQLVFNDPPTVKIIQTVKTSLCDGEAVELSVANGNGGIKWSTGEITSKITVRHSGLYAVRITSPAGCTDEDQIDLKFLPVPALNVRDTVVCTFTKSTVTLTAPSGFVKYFWNGRAGNQSFEVSMPQTVTLDVEDGNGCTASQNIHVASDCPEVNMGNTFTPNEDGINDTWTISGIANDPTVIINIYNRYGAKVFSSKGYYTPWDGRYRGKPLPAGVYYYVLSLKKGTEKHSGWVEILY